MSDLELSVVVPVYDSASTLEELVDRLIRVLEEQSLSFELILVDDGSADASLEILRRRAAADGRVRAIALTRNFGGQAARCAGFDLVRGRRTVCLDADLENLPEDIPALLAALDRGADLACGVREGRTRARLAARRVGGPQRVRPPPPRDVGARPRLRHARHGLARHPQPRGGGRGAALPHPAAALARQTRRRGADPLPGVGARPAGTRR